MTCRNNVVGSGEKWYIVGNTNPIKKVT